jgi:hypothetical protein
MEAEAVGRHRIVVDREQVYRRDLQVRALRSIDPALRTVDRDHHVEPVVPTFHLRRMTIAPAGPAACAMPRKIGCGR